MHANQCFFQALPGRSERRGAHCDRRSHFDKGLAASTGNQSSERQLRHAGAAHYLRTLGLPWAIRTLALQSGQPQHTNKRLEVSTECAHYCVNRRIEEKTGTGLGSNCRGCSRVPHTHGPTPKGRLISALRPRPSPLHRCGPETLPSDQSTGTAAHMEGVMLKHSWCCRDRNVPESAARCNSGDASDS